MKDYSERRPAGTSNPNINRAKKQGVARYFVLTALGGLLAGFSLGLTGGWFLFKPTRQEQNSMRVAAEKGAPATAVQSPPPQPDSTTAPVDPHLSFYNTLPSGKAILGTGLNPVKPEEAGQALPPTIPRAVATPGTPARQQQPATRNLSFPSLPAPPPLERREVPPAEKPAIKAPSLAASPAPAPSPLGIDQARKAQSKGKYVVQVASYQSKSDAEAVKERLIDTGLPAYIVEWAPKDKGIMYRVRVGRHLELSAAEELAARAGKTAIPVME